MKFEHIRVMNFENAFRGMRHPKESYHLSDSEFGLHNINYLEEDFNVVHNWTEFLENAEKEVEIGEWLIDNGVLYKDEPKEEPIEHKENITIDDLDKVEL